MMLVEVVGGRALVSMSMVSILFSDMGSMVEDCLGSGWFVCIPKSALQLFHLLCELEHCNLEIVVGMV